MSYSPSRKESGQLLILLCIFLILDFEFVYLVFRFVTSDEKVSYAFAFLVTVCLIHTEPGLLFTTYLSCLEKSHQNCHSAIIHQTLLYSVLTWFVLSANYLHPTQCCVCKQFYTTLKHLYLVYLLM